MFSSYDEAELSNTKLSKGRDTPSWRADSSHFLTGIPYEVLQSVPHHRMLLGYLAEPGDYKSPFQQQLGRLPQNLKVPLC